MKQRKQQIIMCILCMLIMVISTTAVENQTIDIVRATDAVEEVSTDSVDRVKTVYEVSDTTDAFEYVEFNDTAKIQKIEYKTRQKFVKEYEHEKVETEEGVVEVEIQENSEQEETATTVLENQNNQIQEEVKLAETEEVENSEQEETVTTETQSVNEETVEDETQEGETKDVDEFTWDGPVLNARIGVVQGPSGKETYYNLNMKKIVSIMRDKGFSEEEYPYYIREDGVKMLGDYVMCAACFDIRPRGTIVETSLGMGIVCDTGGFALKNKYQLDIAVDW